ncbi:MAG: response regulator [Myxococcales bacterium]|nr:MAG: response regulator [Myxococcales bacterium]
MQLLVVEDDISLNNSIRRFLVNTMQADVVQAHSLDAANETIKNQAQKLDLVITDIGLADGTGFDVMDTLRTHQPDASVVVITGHNSTEEILMAMRRGAIDFLIKPFELNDLVTAIWRSSNAHSNAEVKPSYPKALTSDTRGNTSGNWKKSTRTSLLETIQAS